MVDLIGDLCIPSCLVVPPHAGLANEQKMSGALWMSGSKLYFWAGSAKLVTSA
jgi:hypothetical protein